MIQFRVFNVIDKCQFFTGLHNFFILHLSGYVRLRAAKKVKAGNS